MPRHLRVEFSGAIYHVTIRGNDRQRIFEDDRDYERFLERLAESVETYRIRLYLFCLLGNHVHLLLETPDTNLSRFMQSVETGYTVYYNLRHRRVGHLFQGRFGAKLVDGDDYLQLAEKQEASEDVAFRQEARRLPSAAILDVVCHHLGIKVERLQERVRNSIARPVAAMMLSRYGGLTNRAIAKILRLSSAGTVTFQLRSAGGITDRAKKATVAAIETELSRKMSEKLME